LIIKWRNYSLDPHPNPLPGRERGFERALLAFLAFLVTAAVFLPAVPHDFVDWDDSIMLRDNPLMREVSWHAIAAMWSKPLLGLYTPMSYTLWLFVAGISRVATGQLDPNLFHALNIALHAVCAALVFALLDQLFQRRSAAFIGAMLFALHPLQVEPAAWAAGMNNLLAAAFALASLNLYIRAARHASRFAMVASIVCAILAMLSKPTAIVLPILAVILDRAFLNTRWRQALLRAIPLLIIAVVFVLLGSFAQPAPGIDRPALWLRPFIAGDALAFYIAKLFVPVRLNMDYGRSPAWLITQPTLYLNWLIPAALLVMALLLRRWRWLTAGVLVFIFAPLPVLGLRPFDFQHFSTVADRYVYLAMLGPAIIAAGLVQVQPRVAPAMFALSALLIIPTELQIRVWENDQTLFYRAISLNPRSVAANRTLGYLAAKQGDLQTAERYYTTALSVRPDDPLTHHNYASLLNRRGNDLESSSTAAAEAAYCRAIEMDPAAAAPHNNLAHLLESRGELDAARREYEQALRLDPDLAPAKRGIARLNATSSPLH
jgi:protein O-mannosyl-transferase